MLKILKEENNGVTILDTIDNTEEIVSVGFANKLNEIVTLHRENEYNQAERAICEEKQDVLLDTHE